MLQQYMPVVIMVIIALGFVAFNFIASGLLVRLRLHGDKALPYECGIKPKGTARIQYSVKFYMVALLFLLFDIETMFIILWALVYNDKAFQLFSLIEMGVFMGILVVGYLYAWKKGAFNWVK